MTSDHSTELLIDTHMVDSSIVIQPHGDIDLSRSPDLRTKLAEIQSNDATSRIVVDLEDVPYMDSSGVATLVEALQVAHRNEGEIVLKNLHHRVRSIFEIARLDTLFKIEKIDSDES